MHNSMLYIFTKLDFKLQWTCKKYRNKAEMKTYMKIKPYYGTAAEKKGKKTTPHLLHTVYAAVIE